MTLLDILEFMRPAVGAAMLAMFAAIVIAAYMPKRRQRLNDEYARIPLRDDER